MGIIFSGRDEGNGFPATRVVQCICNWTFAAGEVASEIEHIAQHREFDRATRAAGRLPVSYEVREEMKSRGRRARRAAATLAERICGAELELRGYFERSYDDAIKRGFGDRHPGLDEYIWAAATSDMLSDAAISAALQERYARSPMTSGRIVATAWEP